MNKLNLIRFFKCTSDKYKSTSCEIFNPFNNILDKYVGAIQYKNAILSKESSKGDFVAERQNECSSKVELAHQH